MRFFLHLFILIFLTTFSFSVKAQKQVINGKFKNAGDNKQVYLYEYLGKNFFKIDSAKLKQTYGNNIAKFTFEYSKKLPKGFYQIGINKDTSYKLIIAEERLNISSDLNKPNQGLKITKSKENSLYHTYLAQINRMGKQSQKLQKQKKKVKMAQRRNSGNYQKEMNKINNKIDSLNVARIRFYKNYAAKYPDLYFSKALSLFAHADTAKKDNFFLKSEFSDPSLTRGSMLYNKIQYYFKKYMKSKKPEQWIEESENILNMAEGSSRIEELTYMSLLNLISNVAFNSNSQKLINFQKKLLKEYKDKFNKSRTKKFIATLPDGPPSTGDKAPDIKMKSPDGKIYQLSDLRGKVVLLDFWASWCGPCRHENPNVVKAYEKYKDEGFTVFSISLDKNKSDWVKAIKKDNLNWPYHVSDLKGWNSDATDKYGVNGIPSSFLINKNGKIIATNLRGKKLINKLDKIFN